MSYLQHTGANQRFLRDGARVALFDENRSVVIDIGYRYFDVRGIRQRWHSAIFGGDCQQVSALGLSV